MAYDLSAEECRVLGSLLEKDLATPEYYPLSLNALVNACNQKSSRDPVVSYDEGMVHAALELLRRRGLVAFVQVSGSRVEKYRHRVSEQLNLTRGELALATSMLLRGPQTAAELRQNTARLHPFEEIDVVLHCLQKLAEKEPEPLTLLLPRLPGTKEPRWAHLFSGAPDLDAIAASHVADTGDPPDEALIARVDVLESQVATLREEMHELRQSLDALRREWS